MDLEDRPKSQLAEELRFLQRQISELRDALPAIPLPASEENPLPAPETKSLPDSRDEAANTAIEQQSGEFHGEERLLNQIVQSSPDGIFAFNPEGALTVWNSEMEKIFGLGAADVIGKHAFEVFSELIGVRQEDRLLQALRGQAVTISDQPFRMADTGKQGFFEGHYMPLSGSPGSVAGVIGFIRDITKQRSAIEAQIAIEARYREFFENANDMVYTLDLEGNLTSLNKAAERITGYSRDEALQMKLVDFVAPDHQELARNILQRQLAGEPPATHEIDIITKSDQRLALEISTHLISREGKPIGVQGIARDVTERKKTEEALQQAKLKLEAWVNELEQRTREMTLLSEMGDMLRACLTTEEAYSVIVRVAQQIFPVQVGALYVITSSRNLVEAVAIWGDASLAERVFSPDECWALRRGRVHWVEDPSIGLVCKHLHHPPPDGYLCVPMMAQSEALGVLHLTQPHSTRLTEPKQRLAVAMAEHIAMALSNLKLHETLRSQSIRDPLTGLFNRRFMEESLELELRKAARGQRPLGLIMLELDHTEDLNRDYGRDAENALLVGLATLLQTNVRKEDIACRFGAEKFTLILPQGNRTIIERRAENLRERIKNLQVRHRSHLLRHFTVSMGAATYPDHGRTVEALIRATDSALHRAKGEGGDCLVVAQ
jgi:diguanylate cyclase (GGDEF)-like protein/PAS domain S-box-containing protein